jgi:anti-anti-sigma regulatory factor
VLTVFATVLMFPDDVLTDENLWFVRQELEETRTQVVHLDLGGVRLPTAEGLGALVVWNKELRAAGGTLVLFNVAAEVYEVFNVANLVGVLDVRRAIGEQGRRCYNGDAKQKRLRAHLLSLANRRPDVYR